jgi:glucose/mannose transport system substrate-binding protein
VQRKIFKAFLTGAAATAMMAAAHAQELKVEVMHNMASPTQQPALQVLVDAFKAAGGTWVDLPIAGGSKARAAMINRAVAGDPAEVMYVHAKLVFAELTAQGLTSSVDPEGWEKWKDHVPASLWEEMIDESGHVVITPIIVGIHNVGFFNSDIMKKVGAEVPKTWDELFPVLDKIKASGDVIPLVFSETPIQIFQTLQNITAGVAGVDLYNRIYVDHDPTAFDTPEFRKVADTLRKLKPYTDAGRSSRVWQDAADLLATDKAGAMVYGTFTLEAMLGAGMVPGKDLECSNLGGIAVLGPNGFMYGRPDNDREKAAENLFASVMMDPKVQSKFVAVGGGIPSRTDADLSSLDKCMRDVQPGMADPAKNVKDPSMTMSPAMSGAVQDAVVEFWAMDSESVDAFISKLKAAMSVK